MMKVHLLYFEGCPNVELTRQNLKKAFSQVGRKAAWIEIDLQSADCPRRWCGFPSPTVLVNMKDVNTGTSRKKGELACRFGGALSIEQIVMALKKV